MAEDHIATLRRADTVLARERVPEPGAAPLPTERKATDGDRGREADLAAVIAERLDAGAIPEMAELRARFAPDPGALPEVTVSLAPLSAYDALTVGASEGAAA